MSKHKRFKHSGYPWGLWFDGKPHILKRGKDFRCSMTSLSVQARQRASILKLRVTVWEEGQYIFLQILEDNSPRITRQHVLKLIGKKTCQS